jgi:hypothetical protein
MMERIIGNTFVAASTGSQADLYAINCIWKGSTAYKVYLAYTVYVNSMAYMKLYDTLSNIISYRLIWLIYW